MGLVSMYWALSLVSALLATPSTLKSNNVLVSANAASYNILYTCFARPMLHPICIFHHVDIATYLHTCYSVINRVMKGQILQP